MSKILPLNKSMRVGFIAVVFHILTAYTLIAQPLNGLTYPVAGSTLQIYTYGTDSGTITSPNWDVSPGVSVQMSSVSATFCIIKVTFTTPGTQYIALRSGSTVIEQKNIVVRRSCSTNVPLAPTGLNNLFYTTGQPTTLTMLPGTNGNMVLWSNNSSLSETSPNFVVSGNSYAGTFAGGPVTMYARTINSTTGCESVNATVTLTAFPSYVKQEVVRVSGVLTNSQIATLTNDQKSVLVSHFDGLGRQKQVVAVAASQSGKDVVAPAEYDAFGRASKNFVAYTTASNQGSYNPSYANEVIQFYAATNDKIANDAQPFSLALYEASPLGRVIEQGSVGADRQPGTSHTQRIQYTFNDAADNVRLFNEDGSSTSFYAVNLLSKTIVNDPNGNQTIVFADKAGRTILKKQQLDRVINGVTVTFLETYYIYDDMGHTKYIISPKGVDALKTGSWSFTTDIRDYYTFQFVYDARNRLIEKRTPGQAWMYFGYDNLNRLVLAQDGLLRAQNKWLFVKYDQRNRTVMQGLYLNATQLTRTNIQTLVLDLLYPSPGNVYYETRGTTLHGHTNLSFPTKNADNSALEILSVNYYDDYDFDNNGTADYNYISQGISNEGTQARAFLLPTGSKRVVLGTTNWLWSVNFYDKYKRPIQLQANNHLRLTVDNISTTGYDFEGKVKATKNYHNAGTAVTVENTFTYDDKGRLKTVVQNNNSSGPQTVAAYEYNELGQLVDKKLHVSGASFLQSVDYRYSIQGQLTSINNAQLDNVTDNNDEATGDYFGMELLYSAVESGLSNTALYNGNISAVKWKGYGAISGTTDQKSYSYLYDKSNKLEMATYKVRGTSSWTKEVGTLNEGMTYDQNGNILTLTRNQRKHQLSGVTVSYSPETIDNLTYVYNASNGNSLEKITDATSLIKGFDNGNSQANNDYTYDSNGNLITDANKGISSSSPILYNFLGKPTQITYSDGRTVNYTYDALGNKLRVTTTTSGTTTTTDYVGSFVYETVSPGSAALKFFGSSEGRVVKNGANYEYEYAIGDHQGNTRVLFTSVTPTPVAPIATFEGDGSDGASQYSNIVPGNVVSFTAANHTTSGIKVVRMNQTYKIGPAKSVKVYPGDKIDMEVWEYHETTSGYGTTSTSVTSLVTSVAGVFGGVSGGAGESGMIYNGVNTAFTSFGTGGNQGDTRPAAYLNYVLVDKDFKVLDAGWQLAPATSFTKQKISFATKDIREQGYIYVWLSYDDNSNNWVYFDDFKVTHTKSNVLQYNEYYPFGLQTSNSWTRDNAKNQFLYNGASELNSATGWYEMYYRGYDPATCRMLQIDPYAASFSSYTPYNYSFNDPVTYNDKNGGYAVPPPEYPPDFCFECMYYNMGSSFAQAGFGGGYGGGFFRSDYMNSARDAQLARAEDYGNTEISFGGGVGGLAAALIYLNEGSSAFDGGFFLYEYNGLTYGGQFFTENDAVTATATQELYHDSEGGWLAAYGSSLEITEIEYNDGLTKDQEEMFDTVGKLDVVANSMVATFEKGFSATSESIAKSKYWATAQKTTGVVAKNLKFLGYAGLAASTGFSGYELITRGGKASDWARFGTGLVITGVAFIPYVGLPLSIGLGTYEAAGGFDKFYESFDKPGTGSDYMDQYYNKGQRWSKQ